MMDVPKGPRELEPGLSLRSALLEEFKNNNKTRRYELKVNPIYWQARNSILTIRRTSTTTWSNSAATNTDHDSSSRS